MGKTMQAINIQQLTQIILLSECSRMIRGKY